VEILHHGRLSTMLHGQDASEFLQDAPDPSHPDLQPLMARLSGKHKRCSERLASQHLRNRRQACIDKRRQRVGRTVGEA